LLLDEHGRAPEHLRAVLVGGAACPAALRAEAEARGWPVLPTYGLTEACSQVATRRPGDPPGDDCGPPLPGVELRIGGGGAIEVRSPALFTDYLPAPARPARDVDGWFETGDLGFLD